MIFDLGMVKTCTSHCRLSAALGNVGGKSQLDQVHLPILNKEKLALFQRPEWYGILGPITTNNLKERKKRSMKQNNNNNLSNCIKVKII